MLGSIPEGDTNISSDGLFRFVSKTFWKNVSGVEGRPEKNTNYSMCIVFKDLKKSCSDYLILKVMAINYKMVVAVVKYI